MSTGVLFLCLGNICRSPLAEGAFRAALLQAPPGSAAAALQAQVEASAFVIDSAGTAAWHAGKAPDPRSVQEARRHGVDISGQRARQLSASDFERFGWIVAMDEDNLTQASRIRPPNGTARLVAFADFVPPPRPPRVPDPYYGDLSGFSDVWRILTRGMDPLVTAISGALSSRDA